MWSHSPAGRLQPKAVRGTHFNPRSPLVSYPGVILEVLASPNAYDTAQLDRAISIAERLRSRRFVLIEPPAHIREDA